MKNNGKLMTLWMYLCTFFKSSMICRILCRIYDGISGSWQGSGIAGIFRKKYFAEGTAKGSIIGKILFCPFTILEGIRKKSYEKINAQKEKSLFVRSCKYYLHNLLALNLKFIGVLVFTGALFNLIISIVLGKSFIYDIVVMAVGGLFYLSDANAIEWVKHHWLPKSLEKLLETEFSYNFFYVTKCVKKSRLICAVVFGAIAGIIGGFTSPIFALAFAVGVWFVFMILYKVEFGVFATVFLAPLIPTMAVVGLCVLCLVSLIIKALTSNKFEWRTDGAGFMIMAMIAIYLVASVLSFALVNSLQIWAVYFAFMIFYFVIINTVKSEKQFFNLLAVFALSALFVCAYGVMQYLFGWNVEQAWMDEEMFSSIKMRIYSTLENPNVLGEYILLALPVCVSLAWTKVQKSSKIFYTIISAIAAVALILTFSRGCWIGLIVAAAIYVTFVSGKLWGLLLIALPLLPVVLPESIISRFTSIGNLRDSSTSYRVYIWLGTLLMLKDFWLSGVGPGSEAFNTVYPAYAYSTIAAPHSHNLFLQITVEMGVIGLAAFILLILVFIKRIVGGYHASGRGSRMAIVLVAIAAAVIGFLVQGMFDNCFYNYRVFMIFWSVIAIGMCGVYIAEKSGDTKEEKANA